MENNKVYGYNLASRTMRFLATITEGFIFIILIMGIYFINGDSIYDLFTDDFRFVEIAYSALIGLVIGALFYPMFTGNLGHKIYGLKVISAETGKDFNKATDGGIRELLKYVLGYLILPSIWILWDDKNQNLYDKLTKTFVVEK